MEQGETLFGKSGEPFFLCPKEVFKVHKRGRTNVFPLFQQCYGKSIGGGEKVTYWNKRHKQEW